LRALSVVSAKIHSGLKFTEDGMGMFTQLNLSDHLFLGSIPLPARHMFYW
jgi:hypothetical protein